MKWKHYLGILTGIFLWGIYAILLMARTKFIIQGYGSEINAVSQSAQQIFNYFILFESGMGAAYLYKMYEPMAVGDKKKIASLYMGLSISMKKIAIRMLLAILPLSFIYAFVMNRTKTDYLTSVLIIILLGLRFVIPYFVSVSKKTLLTLYKYKYLVDVTDSVVNILIVLAELLLISVVKCSMIKVLYIGCVVNILAGGIYEMIIRRLCQDSLSMKSVPCFEAEGMTKSILFHQLSGLLNSNVDTFLLSVVNIQSVTIYQAYTMIYTYPVQLVNKISEIFRASFGIRLAQKDAHLYRDFQRLLTFQMFMAVMAISVFITDINSFICLWIGEEFTISRVGVYLFGFYMIQRMTFNAVYIIRDGKGLYEESKGFSVKEAVMNLILSILLVKWFEIEGVMLATVLSVYLGLVPGNSKLVFGNIFQKKYHLFLDYAVMIAAVVLSVMAYDLFMNGYEITNWGQLIQSAVVQMNLSIGFAGIILGIYKFRYLRKEHG